jgi:hypothetical protein
MSKTTLEILKEARALLAQPGAWTKGAYARDVEGTYVSPDNPAAVCFCAVGAIHHAGGGGNVLASQALKLELPKRYSDITHANDSYKTVKPVLALFDRAIAHLEAAQ